MKRWTTFLIVVCMLGVTLPAMGAMSIGKMRQNTRFLTDRMAYELGLSPQQYDDVYEVNYDFINNVRYLMDDVVRGYEYALDRYYDFLDVRNDDLRWILSSAQYRRFMGAEHFYRPIYAHENKWKFRIYLVYNNVNFFYYGKPHHYTTYCGGHYRTHFNNVSYYKTHCRDRYRHAVYDGHFRIRHDKVTYDTHRHRDFNVAARPHKPQARPGRPSGESHRPPVTRPDRQKKERDKRIGERPVRREQNSRVDKDRREHERTAPAERRVRKENTKKEKDSNRPRERDKSRSNERSAARMRTA